jgi:inner membrane protein
MKSLTLKFLVIGLLMLILLIPLGMIGQSINEHSQYAKTVSQEIARSSSGHQVISGPVLVIPYTKKEINYKIDSANKKISEERWVTGELYFLPEHLNVTATLKTELRNRGIYKARLYHADAKLEGHFKLPAQFGLEEDFLNYRLGNVYLALGISDIRGIKNSVKLTWLQNNYLAEPGVKLKQMNDGVHVPLPALQADQEYSFSIPVLLQGTESFSVRPLGKETQVNLASNWQHPSFSGNYLPNHREVSHLGFNAQWKTSYFSTNMREVFDQCIRSSVCDHFYSKQLSVELIEPVNQYVKNDRAIKYAMLFVALTFAGFFLFEVLKKLQIHPVQYGLVGLALALFYLLLLSLSEHLHFGLAYMIAAFTCVCLIGYYVSAVLASRWRALSFVVCLMILYAMLYGLLSAEDYALLMGSILIFSVLSLFMILTRRVNWNHLSLAKGVAEEE